MSTEIETLKNQVQNLQNGAQVLLAQLDSHKQMLNEVITTALNTKSNMILVQNKAKQLENLLVEKDKQIASLNQQLEDATAKIASFEAVAPVDSAA